MDKIREQVSAALDELFAAADTLRKGDILVIGCSTSEIVGKCIGTGSSEDAAKAVMDAVLPRIKEKGLYLAVQCCEHLNRSLVVERECMEKYDLEEVCVVPQPKAGGSFATNAYESFSSPVVVEEINGHAGMDIGGTLIGMHLKRVAVPVRLSVKKIGEANILCAKTRPRLIGGERAIYNFKEDVER